MPHPLDDLTDAIRQDLVYAIRVAVVIVVGGLVLIWWLS